jgi:hypothetical protein
MSATKRRRAAKSGMRRHFVSAKSPQIAGFLDESPDVPDSSGWPWEGSNWRIPLPHNPIEIAREFPLFQAELAAGDSFARWVLRRRPAPD